jgi:arsenate reductase
MKKIYFLSTCSTCSRIIKSLNLSSDFIYQDIKTDRITPAQLDEMKDIAGSYEILFSRRSMQYKALNLAGKTLTEKDYKKLILEEYTFLKRPVFIVDNQIFVGNSKDTIAQLEHLLGKKP